MKNYLVFLAISFSTLCCSNNQSKPDRANIYSTWDIIYLDIGNVRYIVNSDKDTLSISKFHFEESVLQTGGSINKRELDTTYDIAIQKATKNKLVNDVIRVFRNPIPSKNSVTDYAGTTNLCLVKDETFLCYTFSYSANIQPELKEIIELVEGAESKSTEQTSR